MSFTVIMGIGVDMGRWEVIDLRNGPTGQNLLGWTHGPDRVIQEDEGLGVLGHVIHVVGSTEESQASGPLKVTDLSIESSTCRW